MAIWNKKRKEHTHCSNAYMRTCAHAQRNHSLRGWLKVGRMNLYNLNFRMVCLYSYECGSTKGGIQLLPSTSPPPPSVAILFIRTRKGRTTRVSSFIAKCVVGHLIFLSFHLALSYRLSQWSFTAWNFTEDVFRMNLILASASASPVAPLHLILFGLC